MSVVGVIAVGDQPLTINTFKQTNGSAYNLSGATLTMHFIRANGDVAVGDGTWVITDAVGGIATYQMTANDTATSGQITLYPVAVANSRPVHAQPQSIIINDLP